MRAVDKNRLQVLRRVRDFLKPMAEDPTFSAVFTELEAVIDRATEEGERQERMERLGRSATVSVNALAQELRDDLLHPLSRLVRKVARGAQVDGKPVEQAFALPRQRDYMGLLSAASAIHMLAVPYEEKLVAAGLPKALLGEVQRVAAALRSALDVREQHYLGRTKAAAQGQAEARSAGELLRFINALMRKQVRTNPALRKAWDQAKRLGWGSSSDAEVAVVPPAVATTGEVEKAA